MKNKLTGGNSGFQQFGGQTTTGTIVIGKNARVTVNKAAPRLKAEGREDVYEQLIAVLDEIKAHGDALPDKSTAKEQVKQIATESALKKPDKTKIDGLLVKLSDQVKSVATIATSVTTLAGMLGTLF